MKGSIVTTLMVVGIVIIVLVGLSPFILKIAIRNRSPRGNAREKACYANMRVLLGAVEMYNMDNSVYPKHMDDKLIDELVKGKYLRSKPRKPETECDYYGDLENNGEICCKLHGTIEGPPPPPPNIWDAIVNFAINLRIISFN